MRVLWFLNPALNQYLLLYAGVGVFSGLLAHTPGSHLNCCLIQSIFHFLLKSFLHWSVFYNLQSTFKCKILCDLHKNPERRAGFVNEKTGS